MASILQFVPRQPSLQDWSEAERTRLYEFAAAMADSCGVRIDFGQTDEGDPWCVVLDDNEDVLVHIARIEGTFVAHAVAQDLVAQASELSAALDRTLGTRPGDRTDVVVPFPSNRSTQIVTAVLVAAAFSWSSDSEAQEQLAWLDVADGADDSAASRRDAVAIMLPIDVVGDLARSASSIKTGTSSPVYGAALFAVPEVAAQSASAQAETSSASSGLMETADETAMPLPEEPAYFVRQSAEDGDPSSPRPTVNQPTPQPAAHMVGTNGDDILLVGSSMIASGGAGADQFAIASPSASTEGSQLLGVILDFAIDDGDTLQFLQLTPGTEASVLSIEAVADVRPDAIPGLPPIAGVRLGVDFDADGQEDGFLLLGGTSEAEAARAVGLTPAKPAILPPETSSPRDDAPITDAPMADEPIAGVPVADAPITDKPVTDVPMARTPPPPDESQSSRESEPSSPVIVTGDDLASDLVLPPATPDPLPEPLPVIG